MRTSIEKLNFVDEATKSFYQPEEIAEHLVISNRMSSDDILRVKELVTKTQSTWGSVLDRLGILAQKDWIEIVSHFLGIPVFAAESFTRDEQVNDKISLDFLKNRVILPIEETPETIILVTSNPWDLYTIEALELACNCNVQLRLATERDIEAILLRLEERVNDVNNSVSIVGNLDDAKYLLEMANDAPTIRTVDNIFSQAFQANATDIHVEPMADFGRIRFRVNGVLRTGGEIQKEIYQGVVSRLKILSDMDIAERRLPQDGRMNQRYQGRDFDIRVASIPTLHGESLALRVLAHDEGLVSLETIDMPSSVKNIADWALTQRNGLIVITGPTGSGKTTTLHSALSSLNDTGKKILTAENPVEIHLEGAIQVEARKEIDFDFASILKSFLRHDPDILMIGEIRDSETAQIAIQAALTGRLVFTTLHTNSAISAISRLTDLGIEPFYISSVLKASIAQRLVRVLCSCSVPYQSLYGSMPVKHMDGSIIEDTSKMRSPIGCKICGHTGFSSRKAIFEAVGRDQINRILNKETLEFPTLLSHGKQIVEDGYTTAEELARILDTGM